MDLQAIVDTMGKIASDERGRYHLTLGGLVDALTDENSSTIVEYDFGGHPSEPMSYRGYYSDLSFEPSADPTTVATLLRDASDAIGQTFEGYKGGDFDMHRGTPLWASPYGSANGRAIMGIDRRDDKLILLTKVVD